MVFPFLFLKIIIIINFDSGGGGARYIEQEELKNKNFAQWAPLWSLVTKCIILIYISSRAAFVATAIPLHAC